MKKVYSSDNFMLVGHLRQMLENHHIACIAKNEFLIGGAGELPPTECWPELWVAEDHQYEKAKALVDAFVAATEASAPAWHCPACGEWLEGQFTQCWKCGEGRPVGD
jgi:hypothetical protein